MENAKFEACRVWELVPVEVANFASNPSPSHSRMDSSAVPPYEEPARNNCCTCSHVVTEPGDDGYGTTVVEMTTVTTRKKYRLEG